MSTSIFHSKEQGRQAVEDVKDQARQAANDVRDAADEVAGRARRIGANLRENASDAVQRATGAVRELKSRGTDAADHVRDFIREKPLAAVVGFAAFGLAVGYLLRPAPRKRGWFDASDISDILQPLERRARSGYRDLRSRGADVIGSVQDRIPDHPVDAMVDRARSFGRNFKFW
ncbi:hypothetical protein KBB96_02670 [Luteolibacter ambystomatis]|uniref:Uncharacterized protein n=1 Tax=Luteolibacter ambystomatis TaxID=2824561 RepID=A0A975J0J9_9BACT|nr:hypothetical protein [Luteolibacter ambystomatis]QUE51802.1 hypothetical protein KBB96_02670 [Luteolibacter ambystomatis]